MESIGLVLKSGREAKKITIHQVSIDTNIPPTFLEALENEDFDKIPGETYCIGFLRNYAEYLKLDPEEIIHAYKGYKIGESATPLAELTRPTRSAIMPNIVSWYQRNKGKALIAGGAVLVAAVIVLIYTLSSNHVDVDDPENNVANLRGTYHQENATDGLVNLYNMQLTNDTGTQLVYQNEGFQFMVDTKEVTFILKEIKDKKAVIEITQGKITDTLNVDEPKTYELPECPRKVTFTLKSVTESRAKIMVTLSDKTAAALEAEKQIQANPQVQNVNSKVEAVNSENLKIVFEADFISSSYIELYTDGHEKTRGFIPAGTHYRWEATEHMQVRIGNAGGVKATINNKKYEFGQPGQIANKIITWKKDPANPNVWEIVVKDWK